MPPSRQRTLTEIRQMLILAAPIILAQVGQNSMNFIDTLMVGRLGNTDLAGIALAGSVFMFVLIFCMGILFAISPTVSQAHGAGKAEEVSRATRQGVWLALLLALPAFFIYRNMTPFLLAIGQDEGTVALAASYLRAVSWGVFPSLALISLRGFLEGVSRPRPTMFIIFAGIGLNIFANNALMFGRFGFPALGLTGTGYATSFVYWSMLLFTLLYIELRLPHYRIVRGLRRPDGKTLRELFTIGWPIGMTLGFESGLFTLTVLLMGRIGTTELAAHQIAIQSASMAFMVPVGLASATAVRVGQATGRKDPYGARRSGYVGMALSVMFMSLTGLLFFLVPEWVVSLYIDITDPTNRLVVATAAQFLAFAAMFQTVDGLQVSASGALRGLKDTRVPMMLALFAYWGVGMTTGVGLAFGLGLGGAGLWLGLVVGLATAAVLLLWRFRRHMAKSLPATLAGSTL